MLFLVQLTFTIYETTNEGGSITMMVGDGLVVNFAKISLEETEFTQWLERKPLRYALFMQIIRRASKNKGHLFMMSKTEHKKFGLSVSQAGQIERFLEALVKFKCVQKTGSNQEPDTLKTGTQTHHVGATIYRLVNNEFIDLSKTVKNEKQEPKKEKTGSNQEGSREESITSTSARANGIDINTEPNSSTVEQNTFGVEKTRLLIEESRKEPPFPKVAVKGFSPVERSQALTALLVVAHEFGREIRWESHEQEIAEAVDLFGMDQLIENFRSYAELCRQKAWRVVQWDRFKANKLNKTPTKKAVESVKKMPEYIRDRQKQVEARGPSYTGLSKMQNLSNLTAKFPELIVEERIISWANNSDSYIPDDLHLAVKNLPACASKRKCERLIAEKLNLNEVK